MPETVIKNCQLYHGDCFEILPRISGADAVVSDPPYGVTSNAWDHDIDLENFWKLAKAACRKNAAFVLFCQMPFAARLYASNPKGFKHEWIYRKPVFSGFLQAYTRPLRAHELVYVFCENTALYNPQKTAGDPYVKRHQPQSSNYKQLGAYQTFNLSGERFPTSILDVKHENAFYTVRPRFKRHPTQKSVAALSYLIKTYTNPGDTVLDPFMGSGSTGVAAVKTGRKFIGIERERQWLDVAIERISAEYENRSLLDAIEEAGKPQFQNLNLLQS